MISRVFDTNADGGVSNGDTIEVGRYPTVLNPASASDFEPWGVTTHVIGEVVASGATIER